MEEEQVVKKSQASFLWTTFFVLVLLGIGGYFLYGYIISSRPAQAPTAAEQLKLTPTIAFFDYVTYKGATGKDALTLLKDNATVEQDVSGMVSSINGRKADTGKQEYWAFYVNGKMAPSGPAQYQTQDGEKIEWKIQKY